MPTRVGIEDEVFVGLAPQPVDRKASGGALAERPEKLEGGVIGLVVNGLQDAMMRALAAEVARRTGAGRVLEIVKQGLSVPPEPEDWSRLTRESDAVITGYGG